MECSNPRANRPGGSLLVPNSGSPKYQQPRLTGLAWDAVTASVQGSPDPAYGGGRELGLFSIGTNPRTTYSRGPLSFEGDISLTGWFQGQRIGKRRSTCHVRDTKLSADHYMGDEPNLWVLSNLRRKNQTSHSIAAQMGTVRGLGSFLDNPAKRGRSTPELTKFEEHPSLPVESPARPRQFLWPTNRIVQNSFRHTSLRAKALDGHHQQENQSFFCQAEVD